MEIDQDLMNLVRIATVNNLKYAIVIAALLLIGCGSGDVEVVQCETFKLSDVTFTELSELVEVNFDGNIRNLLGFEGADLSKGNEVKLSAKGSSVEIKGGTEFILNVKRLLNAYEKDGRIKWIREELGQGNVFKVDEIGFGISDDIQ